jgi:hypothetical protein
MKGYFILALLLLQFQAKTQTVNEDSLDCIRRTKALALQIGQEGKDAKYFLDSNWLVYLSPPTAATHPNTLRLINVGGNKQFSVTVTGIKLAFTDDKGQKGQTEVSQPIELIKSSELFHCGSGSVDLSSIQLPNTIDNRIQYLKLRIRWQHGETIATLGKSK